MFYIDRINSQLDTLIQSGSFFYNPDLKADYDLVIHMILLVCYYNYKSYKQVVKKKRKCNIEYIYLFIFLQNIPFIYKYSHLVV